MAVAEWAELFTGHLLPHRMLVQHGRQVLALLLCHLQASLRASIPASISNNLSESVSSVQFGQHSHLFMVRRGATGGLSGHG